MLCLLIATQATRAFGAAIMMVLTMTFIDETVPKAKTGTPWGCWNDGRVALRSVRHSAAF